jgi:alkaline phosphatase D
VADPRFTDYPFALGVASGDPAPDGFVIWTRLCPALPSSITACPARPWS